MKGEKASATTRHPPPSPLPPLLSNYLSSSSDAASIPDSSALIDLKNDLSALSERAQARADAFERDAKELQKRVEVLKEKEKEKREQKEARREEREREKEKERERLSKKTVPGKSVPSASPAPSPVKGAKTVPGKTPAPQVKAEQREPTPAAVPPSPGAQQKKRKLETPKDRKEKEKKVKTVSPSLAPAPSEPTLPRPPPPVFNLPPPAAPPVPVRDLDALWEAELVSTYNPTERSKLLGVASYPILDQSQFLPGAAPNEDFSTRPQKPPNQVNIGTYYTYLEPYFRPFTEEDLGFLRERGDRLGCFLVPPLGVHYMEMWADEGDASGVMGAGGEGGQYYVPKGNADDLTDQYLMTEEISCGPLTERVLAALIKEQVAGTEGLTLADGVEENGVQGAKEGGDKAWKISQVRMDYVAFEERLKKELLYIGLLTEEEVDWSAREDDEICAQLRTLQRQLRTVSTENIARKRRLAQLTTEQFAYQEYTTILDDLDKQVDTAYLKRTRTHSKSKKKSSSKHPLDKDQGVGEGVRVLMERRRKWIEKLGPVFLPVERFVRGCPRESVFAGLENDIRELEERGEEEEQ
ncbi:hypothetical protein SAICODRAFT_16897 [Saitoella complicata NRRL Y-17804]|uniref:Uncharacterized protein n=1 Tax=Saitoella complicata (strain BCRC 22490 / CBS 7301 / JCM 7358 / NBRC 10748 / NRRL Y-17804) TaxID=698492 RepID=A0A0E9NA58_SAICN|nr:uncharacterized protein SAICODRAFT_16897 [Saitoella complicata NRRL Y-17804]ODQ55862.1 hypothetical protein SAICODRAFT_16897 [Saitoella complicata NRRL Y-17804]GAO46772.1 hypothetical protein G7K_0993-t1 [Saitoella complicata NRRL Y-17804]